MSSIQEKVQDARNQEVKSLADREAELKAKVRDLEGQVKSLNDAIAVAHSRLADIDALKVKSLQAQEDYTEALNKKSVLEKEVRSLESQVDRLNEKMKDASALEYLVDSEEAKIKSFEEQRDEISDEIKRLNESKNKAEARAISAAEKLEKENSKKQEKIEEINSKISIAKDKFSELKNDIKKAILQKESLINEVEKALSIFEETKVKVEKAKSKLSEAQNNVLNVETEIAQKRSQFDEYKKVENEKLNKRSGELSLQEVALKEKTAKLRRAKVILEREVGHSIALDI